MHVQELPADAVFEALGSGPNGLTAAEAARRLEEYGANRVERVATVPVWRQFLRQFTHLFAIVLWAAAALAGFAEIQQPHQGMGLLALAIVLVIVLNGGFAFWQEFRSERALQSLRKLLPLTVRVTRDGSVHELLADDLVPGDLIHLSEGDAVPADCRLVQSFGMMANMAAVSGEAAPQPRDDEADPRSDLTSARNVLLAGVSVLAGEGQAIVFATGMRTTLGGIAHLTQTAGGQTSPLQHEVMRLSRIIATLAAGLGVTFFAVGIALGMTWWHSSIFAVGLMVANVPEGLLPTLTLALAMAAQRLAKKRVLVRKLTAVETLGSTTVICSDKTGTLTENRMVANAVFVNGLRLSPDDARKVSPAIFDTAAACHSLEMVGGRLMGDPTEIALAEMAGGASLAPARDGIPFDAGRRRMSMLRGQILHVKGALDAVLPHCSGMPPQSIGKIRQAERDMAAEGLRVLALAQRQLPEGIPKQDWETQLTFLGLVGLEDPPRPEVPRAIALCRRAGIKVVMVTGDHALTAEALARKIGLVTRHHPLVILGDKLQKMSKTQLQLALDAPEVIFARTRADQKWRIVDALQAKGAVVAVTGDGVNDAPALKQADIGIAMGLSGTEVAREAADMILLDDNFASIVSAVEEGRAVFGNLRKFLTYVLTSNVPELVPYLLFAVLGMPLALTVPQILAIDLGTDILPALALATERPEHGVMDQQPRSRHQRLVDAGLLSRAYGFLGILQACGAMAGFVLVLAGGGWHLGIEPTPELYRQATTACLATIVVMQMVNLLNCRSPVGSGLVPIRGNPVIAAGVVFETALLLGIVYTPWGNVLFATEPLPMEAWLHAAISAALLLAVEEGRKALFRAFRAVRTTPPRPPRRHPAVRR